MNTEELIHLNAMAFSIADAAANHTRGLIDRAYTFAANAHKGQVRKYVGTPYIEHPVRVAGLVQGAGGDVNMICAAMLHDVVEDTAYLLHDIRIAFGDDIANLVDELTDRSTPEMGNRKVRKEFDRQQLAMASQRAQAIKCADLIDNTESIVKHDPNFAVVYMREKRALLEVLVDAQLSNAAPLYYMAKNLVEKYYAK